jgi:hypothetical protein
MAAVTLLPRVQPRQTRCLNFAGPRLRVSSMLRAAPPLLPEPVAVRGISRHVVVKIASCRSEWEQAFQLVADNYQARGYERSEPGELRFQSYHALPDTVVLVAKAGEQVVATFSLVPDNVLLGLPMERIYRTEIDRLRQQGRRLFETGSLADRDLSGREFLQVFLALQRLGWQYQLRQGGDTAVITVNPRHRSFYTKALGFVPLGPWRAYPSVRGHPAEAYYIDPNIMRARAPQMYAELFGQRLKSAALATARMPAGLIRQFSRRSSHANVHQVEEILRYVNEHHSLRAW